MKSIPKFVTEKDRKISANWEELIELRDKNDDLFKPSLDRTILYLKEKEILVSEYQRGSYYISGDNKNLGPKTSWNSIFNFKNKEDAIKYKNVFYKNAKFEIKIGKIV